MSDKHQEKSELKVEASTECSDDIISIYGGDDDDYEEESDIHESDFEFCVESDQMMHDDGSSDEYGSYGGKVKKRTKKPFSAPRRMPSSNFKLKNRSKTRKSYSGSDTTSDDICVSDKITDEEKITQYGENREDSNEMSGDKHGYDFADHKNYMVIEKVIKHRAKETSANNGADTLKAEGCTDLSTNKDKEIEFLIKWTNLSYLHCTWETIESLNTKVSSTKKVENYFKKAAYKSKDCQNSDSEFIEMINDTYQEDFTTVDRILGFRINPDTEDREYFCKWKSLNYDESTWEPADLIDPRSPNEINAFWNREYERIENFDPRSLKKIDYSREKFFKSIEKSSCEAKLSNEVSLHLRDYQVEGVKWLIHSWFIGNSVILADEMGLGKTVQIICFLNHLYLDFRVGGPFLIIVPLTTLDSWVKHFNIWAPFLNAITLIGNSKSREIIKKYEIFDESHRLKFNVLLTTYEWALKESDLFKSINWASIIIDEGHRLKNDNSQLYKSLYEIESYHCVLMTGTPLQNSLKELWCLLHFVMPHKFNDFSAFDKYANYQNCQEGLDELKDIISQFMLRRTKKDVEKSLPPKVEQILRVDMTLVQKRYYRWILAKNYRELSKEGKGNITGFLNIIMELKKCCNHASLVCPDADIHAASDDVKTLLNGSGKLILLDKLLCRLAQTNSRILIFSQMVAMLDVLSDYLTMRKFNFQRLDGSMNETMRIRAIEHFNDPSSNDFCFLLSTKAGGLGINLVTADTVIIYDSDWNPQNDLQAQARAHRIGQTKNVKIYRLVTKGSIEEDIVERAKQKMVLDHLVIQTMGSSPPNQKSNKLSGNINFTTDELAQILKFGAGELFKETIEEGNEEPLQELDLDAIIKLAEQASSENVKTSLTRGEEFLGSFKVANFKTTETDETYFTEDLKWQNIIPKSELEKVDQYKILEDIKSSYLPPRRANKNNKLDYKLNSSDGPESDSSARSEEDKNFKKVSPEKQIHLPELLKRDILSFVREFMKFPNAYNRLSEVCKSARFPADSHKLPDLERLNEFLDTCCNQFNKASSLPDKKHKKNSSKCMANEVTLKITEISDMRNILDPIGTAVLSFIDLMPKQCKNIEELIKRTFCITGKAGVAKFPQRWNKADDASLLIGIYYHGYKNWIKILGDSNLNLKNKLKGKNGKMIRSRAIHERLVHLSNVIKKQPKYTSAFVLNSINSNTIFKATKSSSSRKVSKSTKPKSTKSKPVKNEKTVQSDSSSSLEQPTPYQASIEQECVSILKPIRTELKRIEGVKPDQFQSHKTPIITIGRHIDRHHTPDITIDDLWYFIAKFTLTSWGRLKKFYLDNI